VRLFTCGLQVSKDWVFWAFWISTNKLTAIDIFSKGADILLVPPSHHQTLPQERTIIHREFQPNGVKRMPGLAEISSSRFARVSEDGRIVPQNVIITTDLIWDQG